MEAGGEGGNCARVCALRACDVRCTHLVMIVLQGTAEQEQRVGRDDADIAHKVLRRLELLAIPASLYACMRVCMHACTQVRVSQCKRTGKNRGACMRGDGGMCGGISQASVQHAQSFGSVGRGS